MAIAADASWKTVELCVAELALWSPGQVIGPSGRGGDSGATLVLQRMRDQVGKLRRRYEERSVCLGGSTSGVPDETDLWVDAQARTLRHKEQENAIVTSQLADNEKLLAEQDAELAATQLLLSQVRQRTEELEAFKRPSVVSVNLDPDAPAAADKDRKQRVLALRREAAEKAATLEQLRAEARAAERALDLTRLEAGSPTKRGGCSRLDELITQNEQLGEEVADCDRRSAAEAAEARELRQRLGVLQLSRKQLDRAAEEDRAAVSRLRDELETLRKDASTYESEAAASEAELAKMKVASQGASESAAASAKIAAGQEVEVVETFTSSYGSRPVLKDGITGTVIELAENGDVLVRFHEFENANPRKWIASPFVSRLRVLSGASAAQRALLERDLAALERTNAELQQGASALHGELEASSDKALETKRRIRTGREREAQLSGELRAAVEENSRLRQRVAELRADAPTPSPLREFPASPSRSPPTQPSPSPLLQSRDLSREDLFATGTAGLPRRGLLATPDRGSASTPSLPSPSAVPPSLPSRTSTGPHRVSTASEKTRLSTASVASRSSEKSAALDVRIEDLERTMMELAAGNEALERKSSQRAQSRGLTPKRTLLDGP